MGRRNRNAWRGSLRPDQKIEIDLRQLTAVDDAGRDLLAAIQRLGACLIVEGVWMTTLIGELSSQDLCEGAKPQSSAKKPRRINGCGRTGANRSAITNTAANAISVPSPR